MKLIPKFICDSSKHYILLFFPGLLSWSAFLILLTQSTDFLHLFFIILVAPIILVVSYCLSVLFLRTFIPSLKKGAYTHDHKQFAAWKLHLSLSRSLKASGLKNIVFTMPIFRYMYFKAMGARVAYGFECSTQISISDLCLITIEDNTFAAEGVKISAHVLTKDKLILKPIVVKEGSLLAEDTVLRPGSPLKIKGASK